MNMIGALGSAPPQMCEILPTFSADVEPPILHWKRDAFTIKSVRFDDPHECLLASACEMDGSLGLSVFVECFGDVCDAHHGACRAGGLGEWHFFKEGAVLFSELDFSAVVLYTDFATCAADLIFGSGACGVIAVDTVSRNGYNRW